MTNFIQENTAHINRSRELIKELQCHISMQEATALKNQVSIDQLKREKSIIADELIREVGKRAKAEKEAEITLYCMMLAMVACAVQAGWTVYNAW